MALIDTNYNRRGEIAMETKTHNHGRDCPVCGGLCKFTEFNSITSGEEIQAEIDRRRRIEEARKKLEE